jgi:CRP/FNR family transcriptional regulator, cyclic AMP receptor protein
MGISRRFIPPNDCLTCSLRQAGDFCHLPDALANQFNRHGKLHAVSGNATLLKEGQLPRGVYIVCSGRAKLSIEARDGKTERR